MTVGTTLSNSSSVSLRKLSWPEFLFAAAVALLVTTVVWHYAWLSDDSFITLRYVSNTLMGYGPVFNVGERVQGYTHPLWFVLLLLGSLIYPNPMSVVYGYSFLFTLITVLFVGRAVLRASPTFLSGALVLCPIAIVWSLSDPWVSFQTSGLENSLANLLIVLMAWEIWILDAARPGYLTLLSGLFCLTRPDFLVWVAPVTAVLFIWPRSITQRSMILLALVPVAVWLLFALIYYHDIFPNTFYAKVGIYPNVFEAVKVGSAYLTDWFHYDLLAAGTALVFLGLAAFRARTWPRVAWLIGIVLYVGWIVEVGGDFMRGRLFVSVLTGAVFTGALAVAERLRAPIRESAPKLLWIGGILSILFVAWLCIAEPPPASWDITNERKYYPGYSLSFVLKHHKFENPVGDLSVADDLRNYARKCGPVTIDMPSPGAVGYLAGPEVSVIDLYGLTDAFIAHLPREMLVSSNPRPGHPLKKIPAAYLVWRKDIALLPNWGTRLKNQECGLAEEVEKLQFPPGLNLTPGIGPPPDQ